MKSSFCANNGCIDIEFIPAGDPDYDYEATVVISDSKDMGKKPLYFTFEEWRVFVQGVKNNEFDLKD